MFTKSSSSRLVTGYAAGIAAGIAYGLNPLFGVPLMTEHHMSVDNVLFYRYLFAMICLGIYLIFRRISIRVTLKQGGLLAILGCMFTYSSLALFQAYQYVPSGIATTIVFLYPVLVALILLVFHIIPNWQTWTAIGMTFIGVLLLCHLDGKGEYQPIGYVLLAASALSYAIFIVMINRSSAIKALPNSVLTFYTMIVGVILFFVHALFKGGIVLPEIAACPSLLGLALFPTVISTATLAYATREIGATQASVLGVFEPVTAILIGVLVMGEPMNRYIVSGLILTMIAIVFMTASDKRQSIPSVSDIVPDKHMDYSRK